MSVAYLDTHVAVWLHDGLVEKLTKAARREIERCDLLISPMVYLELGYLHRRGRLRMPPSEIFANLYGTFGVGQCSVPFASVAVLAVNLEWTSDPFDRIIVAQAMSNRESGLITADEVIRSHYASAVW
ncbi:MAG: type II toxin-antitoxin system VapC family toxin [Bryobacterales bacterium]|nr:type II toxin-antitoxin system VapC family toxin [Bryobacterales bacterium]